MDARIPKYVLFNQLQSNQGVKLESITRACMPGKHIRHEFTHEIHIDCIGTHMPSKPATLFDELEHSQLKAVEIDIEIESFTLKTNRIEIFYIFDHINFESWQKKTDTQTRN